ncbi:MAG: anthranilate synthase component I [Alphaproteobacteria bacterium]|nr:anthranilate synthase component I [Alphaproteobacteria bacterium]
MGGPASAAPPVEPDRATFSSRHAKGTAQLVWSKLAADLLTPVAAMLRLGAHRPMSFLLESVEGGSVRGRYSIIGLKPDLIWRCRDQLAEINRDPLHDPLAYALDPLPALQSLAALIEASRLAIPAPLPPMAAGLFGYLAYDTVRLVERIPDKNPDMLGIPDAMFLRPSVIAIFDGVEDAVTIVTPVRPAKGVTAEAAYAAACERISAIASELEKPLPPRQAATPVAPATPKSNFTPDAFKRMVEAAKSYIRAGDIFQVVPSQRFRVPFTLPPFALYRSLRRLNPSPFLFYLDLGGFHIVGSSPEILVRLRDGTVTIRPLAGTRPRGKTPAEDRALAEELLADPKERAEHLMLLDLGRNDVGRVAKIGTVKVTEQFTIERYSHVMHIVSNVEGEIDPAHNAIAALMAGFPAGTVSGAPKVRAMEIIDELEPERRGVYGGAVGYFGADGAMDTCIALRTSVVKDGVMYVQAGGGIVADSDPEAEFQETINKSKALIRAAEDAWKFV